MREPLTIGGVIRKLWVGETATYRDHLLRLDPQSRRARFGGHVSETFIRDFADKTNLLDTFVHGFFINGRMCGCGELRPDGRGAAEVAFSLEHGFQGYGIGSALLGRTILAARNRGIRTLHMSCLPENRAMQEVARKHHARLDLDIDEAMGEIRTPRPSAASVWKEVLAESEGLAISVIDAQRRFLSRA
jgi:RimJ/RimL family protein N-acetyltransferase